VKTILWVLFAYLESPRPLVPAPPGAIGRFFRHLAILPLKKGRRLEGSLLFCSRFFWHLYILSINAFMRCKE